MKIGAERPGYFIPKEMSDGGAANPTHNFANEMTLAHEVISRLRSWLPPRLLGGEGGRRKFPIGEVLRCQAFLPTRESRRVPHQVSHEYIFLSIRRELRPVARHGSVKIELTALAQDEGDEKGHRFGGGPDVDQGVALPWR